MEPDNREGNAFRWRGHRVSEERHRISSLSIILHVLLMNWSRSGRNNNVLEEWMFRYISFCMDDCYDCLIIRTREIFVKMSDESTYIMNYQLARGQSLSDRLQFHWDRSMTEYRIKFRHGWFHFGTRADRNFFVPVLYIYKKKGLSIFGNRIYPVPDKLCARDIGRSIKETIMKNWAWNKPVDERFETRCTEFPRA